MLKRLERDSERAGREREEIMEAGRREERKGKEF